MIQWHHILDKQPEHDEMIIQCDPSYEGHYTIGMRKYFCLGSFKKLLENCKTLEWVEPDYYWIYAKDFPFPKAREDL